MEDRNKYLLLLALVIGLIIIFVFFIKSNFNKNNKSTFSNVKNVKQNNSNVKNVSKFSKFSKSTLTPLPTLYSGTTDHFSPLLETPPSQLTSEQPKEFVNDFVKPPNKEEVGYSILYPQGMGVSMSNADSNAFVGGDSNILLTDYKNPESYGESSFNDPMGEYSAKILDIGNTGIQDQFKPTDVLSTTNYASAYNNSVPNKEYFTDSPIYTNYTDNFVPEKNIDLHALPGKDFSLAPCDDVYPNVVKYNDSCITVGDIPYGQSVNVNGKEMVNRRLLDTYQAYTGDYNANDILKNENGLLFPKI